MFEFLLGTAFGIWIGTLHDFTPYIEIIKMKLNEIKKDSKKEESKKEE